MKIMTGRGLSQGWMLTSWRSPELSVMPESESMESWEWTAGGAGEGVTTGSEANCEYEAE